MTAINKCDKQWQKLKQSQIFIKISKSIKFFTIKIWLKRKVYKFRTY